MGRAKREEGNEKKKESPMNYKQAIQFKFKFKEFKFKLNSNNKMLKAYVTLYFFLWLNKLFKILYKCSGIQDKLNKSLSNQ